MDAVVVGGGMPEVRDELTSRGRAVRVAFLPLPYVLALQILNINIFDI